MLFTVCDSLSRRFPRGCECWLLPRRPSLRCIPRQACGVMLHGWPNRRQTRRWVYWRVTCRWPLCWEKSASFCVPVQLSSGFWCLKSVSITWEFGPAACKMENRGSLISCTQADCRDVLHVDSLVQWRAVIIERKKIKWENKLKCIFPVIFFFYVIIIYIKSCVFVSNFICVMCFFCHTVGGVEA